MPRRCSSGAAFFCIMLRPGTLADAAQMADIFNHYVRTSTVIFSNTELSAEDMRRKLIDLEVGSKFPFIVSEESDGTISGYCYAHRWMPDAVYGRSWELTIYLSHIHRGKGIGSAMMQQMELLCRREGAHVLMASITEGNKACEQMCRRAGFDMVGRFPEIGFKFGEYLNDVIYQKIL